MLTLLLGERLRTAGSPKVVRNPQLPFDPRLSVSEIAEASGFESVYAFSRAFKRSTGQAPTVFRAQILKSR